SGLRARPRAYDRRFGPRSPKARACPPGDTPRSSPPIDAAADAWNLRSANGLPRESGVDGATKVAARDGASVAGARGVERSAIGETAGTVEQEESRIGAAAARQSVQIRGELLQEIERHDLERALVRAFQDHARRHAVLVRLEPTGGAKAPAVARLQARETVLGHRRREVVAAEARELEELPRDPDADRMRAEILVARVAAAVAEEAGTGTLAAGLERLAEDVD